ncbi:DNA internalization-related competence protein ComEC/Rec2 [Neobacillus sp. K501]
MNGKFLFLAISALLGVLSSQVHFLPFFILVIGYLFFLSKNKCFSFHLLGIVFGIYLVFYLTGYYAELNTKTTIPSTTSTFYLEYIENRKIDGDLLQVVALDQRYDEKVIVRYKIKSENEKETLKIQNFYSRICKVSGQLSTLSIAKNPNAFHYQKYLATKDIYWIVETPFNPLDSCAPVKSTPITWVKNIRFQGINYLEKTFPAEMAALSAALLFGDRSLFDPDLLSDYQRTGIVHLLAISGLHVSLLAAMFFYLGIRIGLTRQFMTNLLLFILPIYAILTGASPSVIRAVLMIFLILLTFKWKKQLKLFPIDAISIALLIYLFFAPKIIYDAGFQLSFAVSFAIILSSTKLLPHFQRAIAQMLVISIISQIAAMPILLYHFFEISFISIVANLLYIPLFSYVFLPGLYLTYFIQLLFGFTPSLLIHFFMNIISLANQLIDYLASIRFAQFIPGRPNWFFLILYILIIFLIMVIWESKSYLMKKQHLLILVMGLFLFQSGWNKVNPFGEVTMIDVGQGESIVIHLPFDKGTYLIDTGGSMQFNMEEWRVRAKPYEVGRDVVVPFLKGKGITKIDKLILTHGDTDHIGGASSVIEELKVKEILLPSISEPSESELTIIHEAKEKKIRIAYISEGSQWKNGKNEFYVLAPEKNFVGERNSGSIAIFAKVGGLKWFFGGDLDQAGEEKIIEKYPDLTIDVLKAGHHGSKTSTNEKFINHLGPRAAWISAGDNNRYGHPHEEVLERLKDTIIFRTDFQGAITYRFYLENGTFSPFLHKIKQ